MIKLLIVRKRQLGLVVLLATVLTCLYSCDADSSLLMSEDGPSTYSKIKSKYHHRIASGDNSWLVDDTQITVSAGNFWDRMRSSFQLQHQADNPKVKAQIRWYIRHQAYLNRSVKRAAPYMYYIFEQVQKRNLPGELVLLPFIESAFNPFAYSGPGAAGLWQIMPHTGTGYGLKQNWWYDGRRDIHASTNAALDYLTYLESYFDGDWLLAIAAYNTGEGNVQNAVRRNAKIGCSTDFFSLGLAQETQAYVPQLLALAAIISNPEEYPIKLPSVRDEPYLAEVNIGYQIDLNEAAQLAAISIDEIHRLNPAYIHKLTGPRSPCCLLLPIDRVETFRNNLTKLSVVNYTSLQRYKVKRRETIESIAARFQISSYKLRRINHLKTNCLRSGKVIYVPVESPRITGNVKGAVPTDTREMNERPSVRMEAGNTRMEIAEEIQAANNSVSENESIASNQAVSNQLQKISHKVRKGETLQRIAKRYHVKLQDLRRWNHINKKSRLNLRKTLIIMQSTHAALPPTAISSKHDKITHSHTGGANITNKQSGKKAKAPHLVRVSYKVRSGDSLAHIAKKHHVSAAEIRRWNHLSRTNPTPGHVLTIYTRS